MMNTAAQYTYPEELYRVPRPVIVVIPVSWNQVSEEDRQLLNRILMSVNLSLPAVHVIEATAFTRDDLRTLAPSAVLSFGADFASSEKYEVIVDEGVTIIVADAPGALDDACKKRLWNALKIVFNR